MTSKRPPSAPPDSAQPLRVADVMRRRVVTVTLDAPMQEAANLMATCGCGFLPVVDAAGRVHGVVTDRDIVVRACAIGADMSTTPVWHAMSTDVVSCDPWATLREAEERMIRHRKQRLPIIEGSRLCGVLSLADVANVEQPLSIARLTREITSRELRLEQA